jgi:hypothetical protein
MCWGNFFAESREFWYREKNGKRSGQRKLFPKKEVALKRIGDSLTGTTKRKSLSTKNNLKKKYPGWRTRKKYLMPKWPSHHPLRSPCSPSCITAML